MILFNKKMEDWWIHVFSNLKVSNDYRELGLTCKRGVVILKSHQTHLRDRICKLKYVKRLEKRIEREELKTRFITAVLDGKLIIHNRNRANLNAQLKFLGLPT